MTTDYIPDDDSYAIEQEDIERKKYRMVLMYHPSCRDPEHPGCLKCMPDDGYLEEVRYGRAV